MIYFLDDCREIASIIGSAVRRRAMMLEIWSLLTLAALQSCISSTEPSFPVYQVPATIDPTGASDVTDPLLAFFATVPDSSVIRFPRTANYRIENTLLLKNRSLLTFEGNGATFFATTTGSDVVPDPLILGAPGEWPRGRRHWMFSGGRGITLRNMTIRGANPNAGTGDSAYVVTLEAQHGIEFSGVAGVEVSGVTITDVYGDFLILSPRGTDWTSDAWIHANTFTRNGRMGFSVTGARDVVFENNNISEVRHSTFDIEPNFSSAGSQRITIRNNAVGPGRLYFFANNGNGQSLNEDITVEGNTLTGKSMSLSVGSPTTAVRRSRYVFRNNTSNVSYGSPSGALMNFFNIDGLEVRGNRNPLDPNRNMFGVRATGSCSVVVTGNQFDGGSEADILPYTC